MSDNKLTYEELIMKLERELEISNDIAKRKDSLMEQYIDLLNKYSIENTALKDQIEHYKRTGVL